MEVVGTFTQLQSQLWWQEAAERGVTAGEGTGTSGTATTLEILRNQPGAKPKSYRSATKIAKVPLGQGITSLPRQNCPQKHCWGVGVFMGRCRGKHPLLDCPGFHHSTEEPLLWLCFHAWSQHLQFVPPETHSGKRLLQDPSTDGWKLPFCTPQGSQRATRLRNKYQKHRGKRRCHVPVPGAETCEGQRWMWAATPRPACEMEGTWGRGTQNTETTVKAMSLSFLQLQGRGNPA